MSIVSVIFIHFYKNNCLLQMMITNNSTLKTHCQSSATTGTIDIKVLYISLKSRETTETDDKP